ncbi:MAG: epoxide hydrolase family protein [Janthinobacterium lividum]
MVQPFSIDIPDDALRDLQQRLDRTRLPRSMVRDGGDDGIAIETVRRLMDHWRDGFDWREQERRLNRLPHFKAEIDGLDIHFVHQRGVGPAPLPLIVTHGWPGTFAEMERILPLLTDPGAHGGDPSDAFDVVVPSLPGYGFSQAPERAGIGSRAVARLWRQLMAGLGYARFGAQGGDIGAGVSLWLAREASEALVGAHLNYIPGSYRPNVDATAPALTDDEQAFLARAARFSAEEGAYAALHATKPQTLAVSLADSPAGLAAWMAEKFVAWSDRDETAGGIGFDTILTHVALHWFAGDAAAPLRLYKENRLDPLVFASDERVEAPIGVAVFPRELPMPPRSWVERVFDVRQWTPMPKGGHFAALEQPELLARNVRAFFGPLR